MTSISRNNNVVSVVLTTASNLYAGATVTVAVPSDTSFNGSFIIQTANSTGSQFTYNQIGANASPGVGSATAALAPQISIALHQVCVAFQTRSGYITIPSPPVTWGASCNRRVSLTGIPLTSNLSTVVSRSSLF